MQKQQPVKEYDTGKSLKRKKFCKFTKGEHKYVLTRELVSSIFNKTWRTYTCELCGKSTYDW